MDDYNPHLNFVLALVVELLMICASALLPLVFSVWLIVIAHTCPCFPCVYMCLPLPFALIGHCIGVVCGVYVLPAYLVVPVVDGLLVLYSAFFV